MSGKSVRHEEDLHRMNVVVELEYGVCPGGGGGGGGVLDSPHILVGMCRSKVKSRIM